MENLCLILQPTGRRWRKRPTRDLSLLRNGSKQGSEAEASNSGLTDELGERNEGGHCSGRVASSQQLADVLVIVSIYSSGKKFLSLLCLPFPDIQSQPRPKFLGRVKKEW